MKKKNSGRKSKILILLNIVFILMFLSGREIKHNDAIPKQFNIQISVDENISSEYVKQFENYLMENCTEHEFNYITQYSWYFTTDETMKDYQVIDNKVIINAKDEQNYKKAIANIKQKEK